MGDLHAQARTDLPLLPEELFVHWLDEYIDQRGWPPSEEPSSPPREQWRGLLLNRTLAFWQGVRWQEQELDFNVHVLELGHASRLLELREEAKSEHPIQGFPCDSKERFAFHLQHYRTHGEFIGKVALLRNADGELEILDGFHRLAAFVEYQSRLQGVASPTARLRVWVGG